MFEVLLKKFLVDLKVGVGEYKTLNSCADHFGLYCSCIVEFF